MDTNHTKNKDQSIAPMVFKPRPSFQITDGEMDFQYMDSITIEYVSGYRCKRLLGPSVLGPPSHISPPFWRPPSLY